MHSAVNMSAQEAISNVSYPTLEIVPGHSTYGTQAQTGGERGVMYPVLYDTNQNQSAV